jgi:NAD(P)-dependent dehydrogenase (short-subunit alcohol dehydrogenase family)
MAAYNAAKAALATFTTSIQLELGDSRVRIVDLQPGNIRTEFNQGVIQSAKTDSHYDVRIAKTWEIVERTIKNAPDPDLVARQVLKIINAVQPSPRVAVGNVFESKIGPMIFRFLPQRVRLWGLRRYYDI